MTHDELLAKIDTIEARYTDYPTYLALRAVVEEHKPDEWDMCLGCYKFVRLHNCRTLQAIEKELK